MLGCKLGVELEAKACETAGGSPASEAAPGFPRSTAS